MFSSLTTALLVASGVVASPAHAFALRSNHATRASISSPLFPISLQISEWTTDVDLPNPSALSDDTFRPHDGIAALVHPYVNAPDGRLSMQVHYPAGSSTFNNTPQGGVSFYAPGPTSVDLTTAKEATFGYTVLFPDGTQFVNGGILPGLYGGNSDVEAVSCSGGRRAPDCFSGRLMWRTNGTGGLFASLPPDSPANDALCNIPPFSTCNDQYGAEVGAGSFVWSTGARTTISQRVRLNDAGEENGEIEVFANGQSVINVGGLVLRNSSDGRIRGIQMQSFFGEFPDSNSTDATPIDQDFFFSDFSVAITETL